MATPTRLTVAAFHGARIDSAAANLVDQRGFQRATKHRQAALAEQPQRGHPTRRTNRHIFFLLLLRPQLSQHRQTFSGSGTQQLEPDALVLHAHQRPMAEFAQLKRIAIQERSVEPSRCHAQHGLRQLARRVLLRKEQQLLQRIEVIEPVEFVRLKVPGTPGMSHVARLQLRTGPQRAAWPNAAAREVIHPLRNRSSRQSLNLGKVLAVLCDHCNLRTQNRRQGQNGSAEHASRGQALGHQTPFGLTERGSRECSRKQDLVRLLCWTPACPITSASNLGAIGFDRMLIRPDVARRGPGTS